jgi:hypothetical protein
MDIRICTYLDPRQIARCTECGVTADLCLCPQVSELAHRRLSTPAGKFLQSVFAQAETSQPSDNLFERLNWEFGDLGMKLVRHNRTRDPSPEEIYAAMVKIAAGLTRLATEGTDEYAYPSG